jgi:CubicO group peptidase (beta-lactamase class C family)
MRLAFSRRWLSLIPVWAAAAVIAAAAGQAPTPVQAPAAPSSRSRYFPPAGTWEKRDPAAVGMDKAKLDEAIAFAIQNENQNTKDLSVDIPNSFRGEAPYNNLIGPTEPRTGSNGVIIRNGYVVAEWGETGRADMTFSVTKSFLSTVVGVAYDRKLIKNVHDRVAPYMPKDVDLFTSEHNAPITWDHLLRQTSDWYGVLFDKPDWADRPAENGKTPEEWPNRPRRAPGTFYKYNDVRVNVLSLATLYVMKEPLPAVLKRQIMDPIGASSTWHWEPYRNATVMVNGKPMPSVPGGGHHGGGMFINAYDMARFGYLFLHNGSWNGKRLISQEWINMARTPGTGANAGSKTYGFMNWFLNVPAPAGASGQPGRKQYPAAPDSAVSFNGNGQNLIYMDWENDVVVVVRWIQRGPADFFGRVLGAIDKK